MSLNKEAHPMQKCPACDGWGSRSVPPLSGTTMTPMEFPCVACCGTGIIRALAEPEPERGTPDRNTPERLAKIDELAGSMANMDRLVRCPTCGSRVGESELKKAEVPGDTIRHVLEVLADIQVHAARHKHAASDKRFLLNDLEWIEAESAELACALTPWAKEGA